VISRSCIKLLTLCVIVKLRVGNRKYPKTLEFFMGLGLVNLTLVLLEDSFKTKIPSVFEILLFYVCIGHFGEL
jgi:hypothetical protein